MRTSTQYVVGIPIASNVKILSLPLPYWPQTIFKLFLKPRSMRMDLITFIHITERTDIILTMSYRSGFGGPKPVEMGKEYEVEISEISRRGDGIARIQGFVIFVKSTKTGQKTNIRITSVGDRFAKAQVVWIKKNPSHECR